MATLRLQAVISSFHISVSCCLSGDMCTDKTYTYSIAYTFTNNITNKNVTKYPTVANCRPAPKAVLSVYQMHLLRALLLKRVSSNYTDPDIITANSPWFGYLIAKQFVESPFRRLGGTFRRNIVRLGFLLWCLFSFLFRRGVGLLHGGRQVCLGRRGTRLRLGDRRR